MIINFTNSQLTGFREVIFETSGLWFGDDKLPILSNRLKQRMKECGVGDPEEYSAILKDPNDRAELMKLINLVTTNETYFYRCEAQMNRFCSEIVEELIRRKTAAGERKIRIWSAGCSSGEEPYSISICLNEVITFRQIWDLYIYATDISTEVLATALEAKYRQRSIAQMPRHLLKKYFVEQDGLFVLNERIKKIVDFEYLNLVDAAYGQDFDVIFCRNVLIYFRDDTKAEILKKFYKSLNPGGYLFLGPAEMIRGLAAGFRMKVFKDAVVFQKEPE